MGRSRVYAGGGSAVHYGFARAPLELIAHVVENDLPYTEVLTADYIMANPMASKAYGASTQFDNGEDPLGVSTDRKLSAITGTMTRRFLSTDRHPEWQLGFSNPGNLVDGLSSRGDSQYDRVPVEIPHHAHQSQPRPIAMDVLSFLGA